MFCGQVAAVTVVIAAEEVVVAVAEDELLPPKYVNEAVVDEAREADEVDATTTFA